MTVPDVSAGTVFQQTTQLARVNYARPETWSFLFAGEIIKCPTPNAGNLLVIVEFDVIAGLGRSQVKLGSSTNGQNQGFCRFVWKVGVTGPANPMQLKWTSTVVTPPLDEGLATPNQERVSYFPAQDIQCSAVVNVTTSAGVAADKDTKLILHAYFAPRSHVRPEWFLENPIDQFRGDEQGGT